MMGNSVPEDTVLTSIHMEAKAVSLHAEKGAKPGPYLKNLSSTPKTLLQLLRDIKHKTEV